MSLRQARDERAADAVAVRPGAQEARGSQQFGDVRDAGRARRPPPPAATVKPSCAARKRAITSSSSWARSSRCCRRSGRRARAARRRAPAAAAASPRAAAVGGALGPLDLGWRGIVPSALQGASMSTASKRSQRAPGGGAGRRAAPRSPGRRGAPRSRRGAPGAGASRSRATIAAPLPASSASCVGLAADAGAGVEDAFARPRREGERRELRGLVLEVEPPARKSAAAVSAPAPRTCRHAGAKRPGVASKPSAARASRADAGDERSGLTRTCGGGCSFIASRSFPVSSSPRRLSQRRTSQGGTSAARRATRPRRETRRATAGRGPPAPCAAAAS